MTLTFTPLEDTAWIRASILDGPPEAPPRLIANVMHQVRASKVPETLTRTPEPAPEANQEQKETDGQVEGKQSEHNIHEEMAKVKSELLSLRRELDVSQSELSRLRSELDTRGDGRYNLRPRKGRTFH